MLTNTLARCMVIVDIASCNNGCRKRWDAQVRRTSHRLGVLRDWTKAYIERRCRTRERERAEVRSGRWGPPGGLREEEYGLPDVNGPVERRRGHAGNRGAQCPSARRGQVKCVDCGMGVPGPARPTPDTTQLSRGGSLKKLCAVSERRSALT